MHFGVKYPQNPNFWGVSRRFQAEGQNIENFMISKLKVKGKVFPYSLLSVGPGADSGVQAVSPQVT